MGFDFPPRRNLLAAQSVSYTFRNHLLCQDSGAREASHVPLTSPEAMVVQGEVAARLDVTFEYSVHGVGPLTANASVCPCHPSRRRCTDRLAG